MANLNKETILYLTQLSRIQCTEKEQEELVKDLSRILEYVEQLEQIDTSKTAPCNHVLAGVQNVMREDRIGETISRDDFLKNAPDRIGGWIKVPPVIKKS